MAKQKVTSFCANWQEDMDGVKKNIAGSSPFLEILIKSDAIKLYIFLESSLKSSLRWKTWPLAFLFLYFGTESPVISAGE